MKSLSLIVLMLSMGCATVKVEITHKELRKAGLDSVSVTYNDNALTIGLK